MRIREYLLLIKLLVVLTYLVPGTFPVQVLGIVFRDLVDWPT